ncbi:MAG: flagellar M-ring protein FliF [Armatimonadetes bacterium]|nr:flagellar M-ring protein FliF [Armatimonadota bacterium]
MAGLSVTQRVIIIGVTLAVVAGLAGVAVFRRPDSVPLYGRLTTEEASQVVAKLQSLGIPYQVGGAGTTILVPQDRVYQVRLQLASEGVPRGGGAGFELFDKTTLGATEMSQRVNYQRALQGELVRTIQTLEEVESARVHLALPQERLYTESNPLPTASIVLRQRPGATLSRRQIRGITHLAASSVDRLSPERVTIVDAQGNLLSGGQQDAAALGPAASGEREQIEVAMEQKLQTMLDRVLGPSRSVVRVSADVDTNRRQVEEEAFAKDTRAPRSEVSIEETYEGKGGSPAGGPAGQKPSTPSYATTAAGGSNSQYSRKETRTTFEVTKRIERSVSTGGTIRRLSVAVLVDQKVPKEQLEAIRAAVTASAGIDTARKDTIEVRAVEFPAPPAEVAPEPVTARAAPAPQKMPVLPLAVGGGVLALALVMLVVLRGKKKRGPSVETLQPTALSQRQRAGAGVGTPEGEDAEERILRELRKQQPGTEETDVLQREITRLTQERPADVAAVVKRWIQEQ